MIVSIHKRASRPDDLEVGFLLVVIEVTEVCEAGADAEFVAIEEFLKEKSEVIDVKDRVHVIW